MTPAPGRADSVTHACFTGGWGGWLDVFSWTPLTVHPGGGMCG